MGIFSGNIHGEALPMVSFTNKKTWPLSLTRLLTGVYFFLLVVGTYCSGTGWYHRHHYHTIHTILADASSSFRFSQCLVPTMPPLFPHGELTCVRERRCGCHHGVWYGSWAYEGRAEAPRQTKKKGGEANYGRVVSLYASLDASLLLFTAVWHIVVKHQSNRSATELVVWYEQIYGVTWKSCSIRSKVE
eukprot:scaffold565_cov137-Amphora_coffeaeformis.AAC.3